MTSECIFEEGTAMFDMFLAGRCARKVSKRAFQWYPFCLLPMQVGSDMGAN